MLDLPGESDLGRADAYPVIAVCGLAVEAEIAAGPGIVTLCGLGSEKLAARLEYQLLLGARPCRGIISFGMAGGLDPALPPGSCVIADEVVSAATQFPVDANWLYALRSSLPESVQGSIAGVDQPILDTADKTSLRQSSGACAVDMESHRAALIAHRYGVPFAACRVIVDPAYRNLPDAAMAGLRADGTTALAEVLRALAAHPGQLPAMIQLAVDAAAAKRTLREVRLSTGAAFAMPLHPGH
jgi:hopanoid-associated phosphorylase